jgi:hypothetical protein
MLASRGSSSGSGAVLVGEEHDCLLLLCAGWITSSCVSDTAWFLCLGLRGGGVLEVRGLDGKHLSRAEAHGLAGGVLSLENLLEGQPSLYLTGLVSARCFASEDDVASMYRGVT